MEGKRPREPSMTQPWAGLQETLSILSQQPVDHSIAAKVEPIVKTTLEILASASQSQSFPLLLVGGYALQAYDVIRQTMDVDCLVTDTDADQLENTLRDAGYSVAAKTDNFRRYRHNSLYLMDVDVLYVDSSTMAKMFEESKTLSLDSVEFRVPSLLNLIALKLHAIRNNPQRESRDMADIAELIRLNGHAISTDKLMETCQRFAPGELVGRIMGYLK
jgi:predicted nucleotidyltransferase